MQPRGTYTFLVAALIAVAALISSASAHADVPAPGDFSPAVWSDKADYSPGEHVVLSGANWQPGESVHITVNDDAGSTWNRSVDVTADEAGNVTDEFDLPNWFIATYHVHAEDTSGVTATYDFTDGNVKFDVRPTGTTAQFVETVYSSTSNCTGAVKGTPKTINGSNGDTVGAGNNESVRIDAGATSDDGSGKSFVAWASTDTPASPFTIISGTGGKSICVAGFQSGTQNYRATYAANTAPVAAADSYSVNEDATLNVAAPGVLGNDTDADGNTLTASLVSGPSHGTMALNGSGSFSYTPTSNYNGSDSFTYKANDGAADSNTVTVSITVNSVNDAPAGTDKTVTVNEDHDYTFLTGDFGFSDTIDSNTLAAVKITTLATNGSIRNNGSAVTAGAVISVSDITAGNLTFRPAANANGSPYATFTFQVQDNGGTTNGGQDTDQSPNTFTINVTSVNDAPAGTDKTVTINEDGSYGFTAGDFGFTDPSDSPANSLASVTITTLPGAGTLKKGASAVTAGQVIAAADLATLTFTPAANGNGTPYASFTFQVTDNGGTANGGVDTDQSANTFTINVSSVNDAPAGADKTVSTNEDTDYTFTTGDFGFSDPNDTPANSLAAVKVTTTASPGSLKDNGAAVTNGQVIPVADISGGKLTFSPAANANGPAYSSFAFQVQDNGGTTGGGVDLDPIANTITIDVTPVNDRPTAAASPTSLTMNEDAAAQTVSVSGSDQETGAANLTFKITSAPVHGTLKHGTDPLATNDTFTGSPQDVTYKPDANYNGGDSFKFTVTDGGDPDGCGTPGAFCDAKSTSTEVTVPITINSVNDAPAGADKTVTTNEDSDYTLTPSDFGFSDPNDSPANMLAAVTVTSSVTHGTLRNNGADVSDGQSISVADILAGQLRFRPAANANGTGYASFTFQVQDNGHTDNGGVDLDQSANTITFDVTSVNDAPAGADKTVSTLEDHAYTFVAGDFGFSDVSDSPPNDLAAVVISSVPANGVLTNNGNPVSANAEISIAAINAGNLEFSPAANANGNGYASFTFQVKDNGGIANGGVDTDPSANTITVDVTSVNDEPAGGDATVTTLEDHDYVVQTADFAFTDPSDSPADAMAAVVITTTPTHGTLSDDGTAVTAGTAISAADIGDGKLVFHPVADKNGSPYSTFTFQVRDNGGTANGGQNIDQTPNQFTVNVTPVNDKPTASASPNPLTIDEDSGAHTVSLSGDDVETGAADLTFKITSAPVHGTLTHGTTTLATNATFAGSPKSVTYEPDADFHGSDNFKFTVTDRGDPDNCGTPGGLCSATLTSDEATVGIAVNSVNDAPNGTDNTITTDEDTAYTLTADDFGLSDTHDHPANELAAVKITTAPTHGTLMNGSTTLHDGDEVSAADISALKLTFTPAHNANGTGYDSFTFQVRDDGGTDHGGVNLDPDPNTIAVDVTSVNDAPSGQSNTVTTLEDHDHTFVAADFGFSDPDDAPANHLAAVKITTLPTDGTLTNNNVNVTAGQFVSVADIDGGKLEFHPAANANGNGYASFTFQVQDDGGTAHSGVDLDPSANTITVDVTSVNDAPAGTDTTVTTLEDHAYELQAGDFGFTDPSDSPANTFAAVVIAGLPANGTLTNDGNAVHTGDAVSVADINDHKLIFTPGTNANGTDYDSFTFQVRDDGGVANGGVDLDQSANTITVDVTPVNDKPTASASPDSLTIDEDSGTHPVSLSGDDVETGAADLTFKITSAPVHGTLKHGTTTLATDATFTGSPQDVSYEPDADFHGSDDFKFTVTDRGDPDDCSPTGAFCDGKLSSDEITVAITVNSVNDAPSGADNTVTTLEDHDHTFAAAEFGFTDPHDAPDHFKAVKVTTLPGAGTLTNAGSAVTAGQYVSVTDINDHKLKFTPAANANGSNYAHFTFQVQDDGGILNGGVDLDQSANTISVDVTSVNDAPSGQSKTVTTLEDHAYELKAADFGFSDPNDNPANTFAAVVIASLPANGTLTNDGNPIHSGDAVSVADINDHKLVFTPEANANGAGYDSFTFQVKDDGGTANGGIDTDQSANTITVDVTSVNDAPDGTDTTLATNEDTAYTLQTVDFGFTDANDSPANELAAVIITTTPTHGMLSDDGTTVTAGAPISAADIVAGKLKFHPADNANGEAYASFTFQVRDNGGTDNGGQNTDQTPNTITFDVTPVNDKPTASASPDSLPIDEDSGPHTVSLSGADFETSADDLTFTITQAPTHGTLKHSGTTLADNATFTGSPQDVTYDPAANYHGDDSFKFTVTDQGDPDECGTAGPFCDAPKSSDEINVPITVASVNDAPAGADKTVTTLEDHAYTFAAADFGFSDPNDSPADQFAAVKITTLPAAGTLKLGTAAVAAGQIVTVADINSGNLKFVPAANANGTGYASFTFQVKDSGGTERGGIDLDPSANTITVDVTSVNDAPAGGDATVTTLEDHDYVLQASDFAFTDPSDSPADHFKAVKITTLPAAGTLTYAGTNVTAGQYVSVMDINDGKLKFTPAANANGANYASFTFQVQDDGGTANGGVNLDESANTITVNVTSVNDAPAGTDNSVTTTEDNDYTLAAADFGFSDPSDSPANTLAAVKITSSVTHGTLKNNGADVSNGQLISVTDIAAGNLKFSPATNANGATYASFTFQVQDNGGTANGGVDLDQSPNTITVNVTPVNDKPTATASPSPLTLDEDGSAPVTLSATDVETTNAADMKFKITTAPTHGTLKQGTTTLAAGSFFNSGTVTYTPDADYNGADSLKFSATDRGDPDNCGSVGAYCAAAKYVELNVPITVNPVNDAPVLHNGGSPTLSNIVANDPNNGGTSIEDLISSGGSGYITDVDTGAMQGIAVTGAATANGSWQYSTDGGTTWSGLGAVSGSNALLLARSATTKIRFVPNANYVGSDPTITFRAWDQTSGANNGVLAPASPNGGTTAFSTDTDTAGITVQPRAVTVTESCVPMTVVVGQSTTCTTTVKDTDANGNTSNPGGSVSAANTVGAGSVAGSPCTLAAAGGSSDTSRCNVTYIPNSAAVSPHTIKGTYGGTPPHQGGDASTNVTVNKRQTQTTVVCGNPAAMNNAVTCTATVSDSDANGTPSGPTGTVTFSKSAGADGTFSTGGTCTLGTAAGNKASCSVTYTSPDVGVDGISATYNGSNVHASSPSGTASGLAVTYDPSAGFVTGGGTITSPAGAYTADPTLTGQANFGFVSKYQKGQTTPTGQTEFQFQTARFNFHSELYDWLVVSGSKAQYKGTGTVNGVAGFSFMITAVDGSPDRFRMKVWNTATSDIVYDNKLGSPDTFDASTTADTQSISGGSIVVHK